MARFNPEMKGAMPFVSTEKPVRIAASKVEGVLAVMASVTVEFLCVSQELRWRGESSSSGISSAAVERK